MADHLGCSKNFWAIALLGAAAGGAAAIYFAHKDSAKAPSRALGKCQKIRSDINDFLHSIESTVEKNIHDTAEEWTDRAIDTLDFVKGKVESINLSSPKEVGAVLLAAGLFGSLLGIGATLVVQGKANSREEETFQAIASRIASWKPLLSELHKLVNENVKGCSSERVSRSADSRANDLLEMAVAGLRLWNSIKKKERR